MKQHQVNAPLSAAGLAIKASSNADAKTANAVLYRIGALIRTLAAQATVDLSTASGTLALADGKVACVSMDVDSSGTVSLTVGTHVTSANIYDAKAPRLDATKARFGYIFLKNASGSAFTIGTTALDTANVTALYVDNFNPSNVEFEA